LFEASLDLPTSNHLYAIDVDIVASNKLIFPLSKPNPGATGSKKENIRLRLKVGKLADKLEQVRKQAKGG